MAKTCDMTAMEIIDKEIKKTKKELKAHGYGVSANRVYRDIENYKPTCKCELNADCRSVSGKLTRYLDKLIIKFKSLEHLTT